MMRRRNKVFMVLLLLLTAYVVTFSWWWIRSPSETAVIDGKRYKTVEFHYNYFFWKTGALWIPAILFVEKVMGYRLSSIVAIGPESIVEFEKCYD